MKLAGGLAPLLKVGNSQNAPYMAFNKDPHNYSQSSYGSFHT